MSKKFMTAYNTKGKQMFQIPCVDVYPASAFKEAEQSLVFSAIGMKDAIWKPGSKGKITITFGEYGCSGCSPDAAWSHIGNNSTTQFPSMNLGFMDPPYESFDLDGVTYTAPSSAMRNYCGSSGKNSCESNWVPGATVIHEFCHALGMMHEHQNNLENSNSIKLNREAVIKYYDSIGMGEQGAVTNVLERYSCNDEENCEYTGTKYDDNSIMLYYLPDDWIDGPNPTKPNFKLSEDDKNYLKMNYPKNINNYPEITVEFVDRNPDSWKVAWAKKIVLETFEPLLGIKWIFKDNLQKTSETSETSETTTNEPTIVKSGETTSEEEWPVWKIVVVILAIIIALIIIIAPIIYKVNSSMN